MHLWQRRICLQLTGIKKGPKVSNAVESMNGISFILLTPQIGKCPWPKRLAWIEWLPFVILPFLKHKLLCPAFAVLAFVMLNLNGGQDLLCVLLSVLIPWGSRAHLVCVLMFHNFFPPCNEQHF
jgi:hypothetical protein